MSRVARFAALAVTAACAALTVVLTVLPGRAAPPYHPPAGLTPSASPQRPATALFVGDSYLAVGAPSVDGTPPTGSFAAVACTALKLICNADAQKGTGYVADGHTADRAFGPYGTRLAHDAATYRPDYVVVTGGRDDAGEDGLRAAVATYLASVKQAFPTVKLFVVEPLCGYPAPDDVVKARGDVRAAAEAAGATWVPSSSWFTAAQLGPDKVRPTPAGQIAMGTKLADALTKLGLAPSVAAS